MSETYQALKLALVPYSGVTTANGNAGGSTLIDLASAGMGNDFYKNKYSIVLTSGTYRGFKANITAYTSATGAFTISPAVGAIIATGTKFGIVVMEVSASAVTNAVVDNIHDTDLPAVKTVVDIIERHLHNVEQVYGLTTSTLARKSLTPISIVTGADPAYGLEIELHNGAVFPDARYDLRHLYLTDFGTANRYTILEFYSGTRLTGVACTFNADDTITVVGDAPADGTKVMISAGIGTVDAALTIYEVYYVRDSTGVGHTFKLALTVAGGAINLTGGTDGAYHLLSQSLLTEVLLSAAATTVDAVPIQMECAREATTNRLWCRGKSITGAHTVKFFVGLHTYVS